MKHRVILLHGARGGPDTNWFPWLEAALPAMEVLRPRFPTPAGQSLAAWSRTYDRAVAGLAPAPTHLVGHSLGAAFALRLVERAAGAVEGLFLASAFVGALGLPDYDAINASFFTEPFDWPGIRSKVRLCRCWAGDDDPAVPLDRSQEIAEHLGSALEIVPGGGHLNAGSRFFTFPQLRDAIVSAVAADATGRMARAPEEDLSTAPAQQQRP